MRSRSDLRVGNEVLKYALPQGVTSARSEANSQQPASVTTARKIHLPTVHRRSIPATRRGPAADVTRAREAHHDPGPGRMSATSLEHFAAEATHKRSTAALATSARSPCATAATAMHRLVLRPANAYMVDFDYAEQDRLGRASTPLAKAAA